MNIPVSWSWTEDILPLLGFATALIMIMMIPVRRRGVFNVAAKVFFASSVLCYFVSTSTSILSHFGLFPPEFEPVITSIELLWVPLILFGVYAVYSNQQLNDSIVARHEVARAGDMLKSVMDTTPAGVLVLDRVGSVTFANPEARHLLDMDEAPGAESAQPQWSVSVGGDPDGAADPRGDFSELLSPVQLLDVQVSVSWPNGWRRRFIVNTTPLTDDDGDVTGAVAAFVEREPWSPANRLANTAEAQ
jgi:PAS domain-containing protein